MKLSRQAGFTLVELLVAMAVAGFMAATIIGFFISQQKSHSEQEQVTFMQQNMRAGLGVMTRELRMAGFKSSPAFDAGPDGGSPPQQMLGLSRLSFRFDLNGDGVTDVVPPGDPAEEIVYTINGTELKRNDQVLAEDIEAIAFAFAFDGDGDGQLDTSGGDTIYAIAGTAAAGGVGPLDGTVNWYQVNPDGSTTDTGTEARGEEIRAVKIWLLGRTGRDPEYVNNKTYVIGTQIIAPGSNDNLHRRHRVLETVVRCRNLGL